MGHPLEDMILLSPVEIVRCGRIDEVFSLLPIHLPEKDKPIRIFPGNRLQQDGVHHAEHGGVHSDA